MKVGFVAGAFDLLHAGHVHMFKEAKKYCDILIVAIHVDPSTERIEKNSPVESILERQIKVMSCTYVDKVVVYERERDIERMLIFFDIDIRFLGSDYIGSTKAITAKEMVEIRYLDSLPIHTSEIRERIKKA